jgi:hypothetical protein
LFLEFGNEVGRGAGADFEAGVGEEFFEAGEEEFGAAHPVFGGHEFEPLGNGGETQGLIRGRVVFGGFRSLTVGNRG